MDFQIRVATNQAPPLIGHNVVTSDLALTEAVVRHSSPEVVEELSALGAEAGTGEAREHGMLANRHHPELTPYDRYGNRIDEVEFHPSWHWLMERAVGHGLQAAPWESESAHAHVRRAAGFFAWSQTEPGHGCPISMTYAAIPALRVDDAIAKEWTPRLASTTYDPSLRPIAEKAGALAGMGMTEKQGGSDVRTNVTEARPTSVDGEYTLHGHKWFTSAPMNDMFLVLAQAPEGVTCFVVPRMLPSGERNQIDVVRLKDKLGNRSNASCELEFNGTLGAAAGRRGPRRPHDHRDGGGDPARLRPGFGGADAPVAGRGVVARGAPLGLRFAAVREAADAERDRRSRGRVRGGDGARHAAGRGRRRAGDPHEAALRRIALPLAKFWVCKRTPSMVAEALECLGGNGYVEESGMPLMFRESPLNSIWEGSGNVNALDVLRALSREPEALQAWITEVGMARGADARLDRAVDDTLALLGETGTLEAGARRLAGQMAACLQGSLLVRFAPAEVADAFCASRLGSAYSGTFGTLQSGDLARSWSGPRRSL